MKMKICMFTFLFSILLFASHANASVIYTVQKGDTLGEIAKSYKTSISYLQKINGIENAGQLIPGQALFIPGETYIVRQGDSLWKLANLHQTSVRKLEELNGIKETSIQTGTRLVIPQGEKRLVDVGAFFVPSTPENNSTILKEYNKFLTSSGVFEYHPDETGRLSTLHGEDSIKKNWKSGLIPYATLTNLSSQGFDPDLVHRLLSDKTKESRLIEEIATVIHDKQFKGIIIDFEGIHEKDRDLFNTFIAKLNKRLDKIGGELGIAVPPKQGDAIPVHSSAYDYQTLGKHVDFMFIMTYDWHWPGGDAGPIAPIKEVKKTLDYAVTVLPKEKIFLGLAMYAYDWTITPDGEKGVAYSQKEAMNKAVHRAKEVHYDYESAAPWYRYKDSNGIVHEVWFEDARSILPKYRLVKQYELAGLGGWKIGLRFPQAGYLLTEEFHIKK
ncbi:glycosyl hydrolase family 18 protein [Pontibacillus salicampi]|uniref:Glycosyl hydrolase family 18 protein n=1 Tax=Pontibacillus salicampi TaxID=1449801 RepID=A0ABV6LKZ7_9BACI